MTETGNDAKKREALDAALRFIGNLEIEPYSPLDEAASELRQKIMDALSEPARNCDVGTAEEQAKRFREFCQDEKCGRCRCRSGCKATCIDRCALAWAQTPYEAEEGGKQ